MNEEDKLDPIMVKNPKTDRLINIAPLFEMVNYYWGGCFYKVAKAMDEAAVRMACSATEDSISNINAHTSLLFDLFTLRDTFDNISEYKEERR